MGYEAIIRKQAGLLSLSIYAVLQRQTACIFRFAPWKQNGRKERYNIKNVNHGSGGELFLILRLKQVFCVKVLVKKY